MRRIRRSGGQKVIDTGCPHPYGVEPVADKSSKVKLCTRGVGGDAGQIMAPYIRFLKKFRLHLVIFSYRNINSVGSGVKLPLEGKLVGGVGIHDTEDLRLRLRVYQILFLTSTDCSFAVS